MSQNRIDSLRAIVDAPGKINEQYLKDCSDLCGALINTDEAYLIPEYAEKGLRADPDNRNIQEKFILYGYLGNYYWQTGRLENAADQFNQMLLIGETASEDLIIANSYNGLGTVNYLMENYEEALGYYRKGLALSGTDTLLKVRLYNNIANSFKEMGKMDSVFTYYDKSIVFHQAHQNFYFLSIAYSNTALAYKQMHNGPEVMKNITLALDAANKSEDLYQITAVYQNMGFLAIDEHPDYAYQCFNQALEIARKAKSFDQIRYCLESLAYIAENKGKYQEANDLLRETGALADSLDLAEKRVRLQKMEDDHLMTRATLLKERKVIEEDNRQRFLFVVLIAAFGSVLALFIMGFIVYRLKMKITRTKERFFSMIAHDIRNPFSGILGLSGLINEEAEKSGNPVHRKQAATLHRSLNQVYDLLENLLQWSQAETGKIAFIPKQQLLSPFVHEAICLNTATAKQKGISLENQIQSGLTARFDSNMLQTIIRNLLSNAIKFSPENSTIFISAEVHNNEVVVKVRDHGVGMNPEQVDRISNGLEGLSTKGTRNEAGTGLGLVLCNNFITRHGGRIFAESEQGIGTTICFTLPDKDRKG